jgi:putative membrane protein
MLFKQHIASAAIVIIVASFCFGCETRQTEFRAAYNNQSRHKEDSRKKQNDATFLLEAYNDLLLEARLAELASKEATSPQVREFAISVKMDHTPAIEEIQDMASRIDVVLPKEISEASQRQYSRIARMSGLQFDKAYCNFVSENNSIVLKKFEKIAQEGKHDFVKDWAWGKLGILKRQIALAQEINQGGSNVSAQFESSVD